MNWTSIFLVIGAGLILFILFRAVSSKPELFSKKNLGESLTTMGFLALLIIAVVAVCAWYLRSAS